MKKNIAVLILLLTSTIGVSQVEIELKTQPIPIETQSFFISNVLDNRLEKYLGITKEDTSIKYKLKNGASNAVLAFMNETLKSSKEKKPIIIEIKSLEIQQKQSSINQTTARVYIELIFYETIQQEEKEIYRITHKEDDIFSSSDTNKISKTHEKRIRAALEYCLLGFINNQKNTSQQQSKIITNNKLHFKKSKSLSKTIAPLDRWINLLTYQKTVDKYYKGWEVSYTGFVDSDKDFIIPFTIGYGHSVAKTNIVKKMGYDTVKSFDFDAGFNGLLKIDPNIYIDLGVSIPLGVEVLKKTGANKTHNFVIGIGAKQGILFIPWKEYGFVAGIGIYQKFKTSKVYKSNYGIQFKLGVNF